MIENSNDKNRRARRNRRRGRSNTGAGWVVLTAIAFVALAWGVWSFVGSDKIPEKGKTTVLKVKEKGDGGNEKEVISQRTFVVLALSESGEERVSGALQVVFDPAKNNISGLIIDPGTFVSVPGRGLQPISEGNKEGIEKLADAVAGVVGIDAEGYLVISESSYNSIISTKELETIFSDNSESSVSAKDAKELSGQFDMVPGERRSLYELPVRDIQIGESTYYEPIANELARLVEAIWSRKPEKKNEVVRVIILNGCGEPGIGRKAADLLVGDEFEIIDVKNADSFDYANTKIMIYNKNAAKAGNKISEQLGVGDVIEDNMAQDVTDIVVLVGKDFI